jgi:hypothetical protein
MPNATIDRRWVLTERADPKQTCEYLTRSSRPADHLSVTRRGQFLDTKSLIAFQNSTKEIGRPQYRNIASSTASIAPHLALG